MHGDLPWFEMQNEIVATSMLLNVVRFQKCVWALVIIDHVCIF